METGRSGRRMVDYQGRVDAEILGLKGLTSTFQGVIFLLMLPASIAFAVLYTYVDDEGIRNALRVAVSPLSVFLAIGGLYLISEFAGQSASFGEGSNNSMTIRIASMVAKYAGISLLLIIYLEVVPEGDIRQAIGALILVIILVVIVLVTFGRDLIADYEKFIRDNQVGAKVLTLFQRSAWVIDIVVWLMLLLLVAILWLLVMATTGSQRTGSTYFWIVLNGTALFHIMQVCMLGFRRQTLGQQLARVQILKVPTGRPLQWQQAGFRTSLPLSFIYLFYVFEFEYPLGIESDVTGIRDVALSAATATAFLALCAGLLSYTLLRNVHAHGQGILDLLCGTVSVSVKEETGEANAPTPSPTGDQDASGM
ncbi:RDD family protein [Candidatus Poriferisocius sp.]|uniref:RDD family protein n=1 Tax=Candidatus Poriferisocius sp. TaxID=3101276 RepID=UPI003B598287